MKKALLFTLACCLALCSFAQKNKGEGSIIRSEQPITWLGLDFTQARFIGTAAQWKDVGEITDDQMRDKYIPAWNDLFITDQKKYDVAKYVERPTVAYAMEVTRRQNSRKYPKGGIFSDNPEDFTRLNESMIATTIKGCDFQGKTGIGLLFIVEGMSKGRDEVAAWVTFVDMGSKKVLQTQRIIGRTGGIGFRNFYGKGFLNVLKEMSGAMR